MGTVYQQPPRDYFRFVLKDCIADFKDVAKECGVTLDQVIASAHALELQRQNNIMVQSGDYQDEQVSGIAELLRDAVESIQVRLTGT